MAIRTFASALTTAGLGTGRKCITVALEYGTCIDTITNFAITSKTFIASAFVLSNTGHSAEAIVIAASVLEFTVVDRFTLAFFAVASVTRQADAAMCSGTSDIARSVKVTVAFVLQLAVVDGLARRALATIASVAGANSLPWNSHRAFRINVAATIVGQADIDHRALYPTACVTHVAAT